MTLLSVAWYIKEYGPIRKELKLDRFNQIQFHATRTHFTSNLRLA